MFSAHFIPFPLLPSLRSILLKLQLQVVNDLMSSVTWDTRVSDILGPGFQLANEELTREMTLRDLLAHRTGLSSGNLAVQATYPDGRTRADLVRWVHRQL